MIVLIITPTRNVANYLDETIFSLVSQQGNFDLYIHIQDSCSTDGTLDIVHKWKNILESENDILPNTDRVNLSYLSESRLPSLASKWLKPRLIASYIP
jgi:glycosyltransferase involved in cell wall biosynthesis